MNTKQKIELKFKKDNPDVAKRKSECAKILEKCPDNIPIICEKDPRAKIKEIDKTKYLVPLDLTVAQFILMIRKRLELEEERALFLLVYPNYSIAGNTKIFEVYAKYKDPEDNFLYILYSEEQVWGNTLNIID